MTRLLSNRFYRKQTASGLSRIFMACAAIGAVTTLPMSSAYAQDEGRQFSSQTGEIVNQAVTLANNGNNASAAELLQQLIKTPDLNPYERSTIYQMMGQFAYELDRLKAAQSAFENAVQAGGLLPKEAENTHLAIAQLMIGNGQYRGGAERLETLLNTNPAPKPQHIKLLMNAWIQAKEFQRALPWAEKWFAAASPKTREHFDLLNYLFNTLNMRSRQSNLVKEMISRWPEDKTLWDVWASMLSNGGFEEDAFEVKKMLYLGGALNTEDELLKIVQYYSFYDMPYQAAEILEREIAAKRIARTPETLTQLSTLFRQAREYERAIPILEAAALQSGKGETYAAWGEALYNDGQCQASETAFSDAINRGYDAGKSWMLIASCRYDETVNLERLNCEMSDKQMAEAPITRARNSAIAAFEKVPNRSRENGNAKTWIQFIETEKQAVKLRCDFGEKVKRDECFKKIKQAYDAKILTREFTLDDKSCGIYIEEYDALYRQTISSE